MRTDGWVLDMVECYPVEAFSLPLDIVGLGDWRRFTRFGRRIDAGSRPISASYSYEDSTPDATPRRELYNRLTLWNQPSFLLGEPDRAIGGQARLGAARRIGHPSVDRHQPDLWSRRELRRHADK